MPQADWLPPHVHIWPYHGAPQLQAFEGRHALVADVHYPVGDYEEVVERWAGEYRGRHRRTQFRPKWAYEAAMSS